MISGDVDDLLRQDGSSLWLRAPLEGEIASWSAPLHMLDPMFSTS